MKKNKDLHKNIDIKYDKLYILRILGFKSKLWGKKNLKWFFNRFIFISFLPPSILSFFPSWRLSLLPTLYFNTWLLITHDFCSPLTLNTSINIWICGNEALTAQRAWCSSEHEVYLWCCRAAQRRVHKQIWSGIYCFFPSTFSSAATDLSARRSFHSSKFTLSAGHVHLLL